MNDNNSAKQNSGFKSSNMVNQIETYHCVMQGVVSFTKTVTFAIHPTVCSRKSDPEDCCAHNPLKNYVFHISGTIF